MGKLDKVKVELKKFNPPGNMAWLAKEIGIDPSLLSNYNASRRGLAFYHKVKIANLFKGIKLEDLFDDEQTT